MARIISMKKIKYMERGEVFVLRRVTLVALWPCVEWVSGNHDTIPSSKQVTPS